MPVLMDLSNVSFPSSCEQIFGRGGPLVLEAGFGNGRFLAHMARKRPTWNFLGADISTGSTVRALRRMWRKGIENVRIFQGPVGFVVRNVIPRGGLHHIYVNFPDPWPKKRHSGKRLLSTDFFRLLSTRLRAGGTAHLTTDHTGYFAAALKAARTDGLYEIIEAPVPPATLATKYAQKWRERDISIHHARLTVRGMAEHTYPPDVERQSNMHHAHLQGELPTDDAFESFVHRFRGGQIVFLDAMRGVGDNRLVFTARIQEGELTQDVLIEARRARKGKDDVILQVMSFGRPLPTRGTGQAVRAAGEWLESRGMCILECWV